MHAHTTVSGTYAPAGAKTDPRQPAGQQAEAAQPMANYERRDRRRRGPRVFENNEISTNVSYQLRFFRNIVGQTQVQQGRRFCECIRCHPRHTSTNYHESRACPYPHPHSNTHRHRGNHTHTHLHPTLHTYCYIHVKTGQDAAHERSIRGRPFISENDGTISDLLADVLVSSLYFLCIEPFRCRERSCCSVVLYENISITASQKAI